MAKKRDIEKFLRDHGWWQVKGTKHDKWTNGSEYTILSRTREIKETIAKSIMKLAAANPGKERK